MTKKKKKPIKTRCKNCKGTGEVHPTALQMHRANFDPLTGRRWLICSECSGTGYVNVQEENNEQE